MTILNSVKFYYFRANLLKIKIIYKDKIVIFFLKKKELLLIVISILIDNSELRLTNLGVNALKLECLFVRFINEK